MKRLVALPLALAAALAGGAAQDVCGPFIDLPPALCPFVAELYYTGITAGTSSTTFSPNTAATRGQAAVFVAKSLDQALKRGSRRAALGQWWTLMPRYSIGLGTTAVGGTPGGVRSDGKDVWVADGTSGTVSRVRASDGRLLESWMGAEGATDVLVAMGHVFVGGAGFPGHLYMLDPAEEAGSVTAVSSEIPAHPFGLALDGSRLWTANFGGSVSIVTPSTSLPWSVTNVPGFSGPFGIVYDGSNIWVTEVGSATLRKLDSSGAVLQTVSFGTGHSPRQPTFDGANIWVPLSPDSVAVVRASSGQAADFSQLGSYPTSWTPTYVCSDGLNFWIALIGPGQVARF
jgi:hypothetical protein